MKLSTWLAIGLGVLLVVVTTLQPHLKAQRMVKGEAVMSTYGFTVEEVKVGQSCVVIVSQGPNKDFTAVPCRP